MSIWGWREVNNGSRRRALDEKLILASQEIEVLRDNLAKCHELQSNLESQVKTLTADRQSMEDRASNLAAQRDHLKIENTRLARREEQLQSTNQSLATELENSLHHALDLEVLPNQLGQQLKLAEERIHQLESTVDEFANQYSGIPEIMEFDGVSSDESVFALKGIAPAESTFPYPILLCQNDRILMNGWISRIDGDTLIGHAGIWHQPASALVKGEKVFILPHKKNEAD